VAVSEIPDIDELLLELEELEQREREISALRSKIFDRLASFPNEITQQKEREVSAAGAPSTGASTSCARSLLRSAQTPTRRVHSFEELSPGAALPCCA